MQQTIGIDLEPLEGADVLDMQHGNVYDNFITFDDDRGLGAVNIFHYLTHNVSDYGCSETANVRIELRRLIY